jgi:hypothetical protein
MGLVVVMAIVCVFLYQLTKHHEGTPAEGFAHVELEQQADDNPVGEQA